jgi:hypothetical protein
MPDGEVVSNHPDEQPPADTSAEVLYARPSTELSS